MAVPLTAAAQELQGDTLVKALQHGGYVIVMRHTSSPNAKPDKPSADHENINAERQLDANGRDTAAAFGKALRDLKIPIGEVLTSPAYRARETARYAQLPNPRSAPELGDNGQNMQAGTQSQTAWLRKQATQFPSGSNAILITHAPNIMAAFPQASSGLSDGEALVFGPDSRGGATLVAHIKIEEWPKLRL